MSRTSNPNDSYGVVRKSITSSLDLPFVVFSRMPEGTTIPVAAFATEPAANAYATRKNYFKQKPYSVTLAAGALSAAQVVEAIGWVGEIPNEESTENGKLVSLTWRYEDYNVRAEAFQVLASVYKDETSGDTNEYPTAMYPAKAKSASNE